MKIADIYSDKLSEGLGRCPKNPQGTSPLTHFRALPEPILAGRQERGAVAPFLLDWIIRELYVNKLSRHILTVGEAVCFGIPRSIDNSSAPLQHCCFSAYSEWSAAQERLRAAICRACYQLLGAFLLR